jgi:hypothetical protein
LSLRNGSMKAFLNKLCLSDGDVAMTRYGRCGLLWYAEE